MYLLTTSLQLMVMRSHIPRLHVERLLFLKANERTSRSSLVDRYICLEEYRTFNRRPQRWRTTLCDYSYLASPHCSVK